jgi:pSer/pThr/pTyr-binding forkhead associated (FHA) protein/Tfp pilus assembly protein PilF
MSTLAPPKARLMVREGTMDQKEYVLAPGKTLLGRAEECNIRIPHPSVSRRHAEIEMGPQGIILRDLASTSGTFLGQRQVKEAVLKPGDSIRLGPVVLELAAEAEAAVRQTTPVAKKEKPAKKKPEKKAKPSASPAGRRRLLLYGAGAAALAFIVIALFSGGGEDKTKEVAQKATQTQKQIELDQTQRLVVINLTHAKKALAEKAYEKAVTHLQNVLSADPQNAEGRKLMDEAQKAIRQAEEERQRAAQEKEKKSQEALALLTQAQEALVAKDYNRARELGQKVLAVDPNQAQARYLLIKAQADQEQAARREKFAQEEAAQRQAQAEKLLTEGKAQIKAKKTALAVQSFKKVLEVDPEAKTPFAGQAKELLAKYLPVVQAQAAKYVKDGQSDLGKGRLTKAVANFNQALRLDPGNQKAVQGLADARQKGARLAKNLIQEGKVLDSLGKTQQACAKYRQAAPLLAPDDPAHAEVTAKIKACQ